MKRSKAELTGTGKTMLLQAELGTPKSLVEVLTPSTSEQDIWRQDL